MVAPLYCHLPASVGNQATDAAIAWIKAAGVTGVVCDASSHGLSAAAAAYEGGFKLIGLIVSLNLRERMDDRQLEPVLQLLAKTRGVCVLRLMSTDSYDKPSSPRAMPAAAALVTDIAKLAARLGVGIALDHRAGHWMQRVEDAVRVAMRVNRKDVGVTFNLHDWHTIDGQLPLLIERMKLAMPKLRLVSVPAIADRDSVSGHEIMKPDPTIDTAPLRKLLIQMGYAGPVSLRCAAD